MKIKAIALSLLVLAGCATANTSGPPVAITSSNPLPYTIKQGESKVAPYDSICAPATSYVCIPNPS